MRTSPLFLGSFALTLLLLACAGPDQPTAVPSSERATAEPTDLPDSERPIGDSETQASPAQTRSTPGSGASPTPTGAPAMALPSASGSTETDREALVALYHATNGPNWKNNTNWLSDAPLEEWDLVVTDDTGRVIALLLNHNQLAGPISPHLGNLVDLKQLHLAANQLSGETPPQLGNLSNLKYLNLEHNDLNGEIPLELGDLSNLTVLGLGGN